MSTHVHSYATEALLVISQTCFFVFLFIFLKRTLLDNRGMMSTKNNFKENGPQIGAILFAILVLIALMMIPLQNYEYAEAVVISTVLIMFLVVARDIVIVFGPTNAIGRVLSTPCPILDGLSGEGQDVEPTTRVEEPPLPQIFEKKKTAKPSKKQSRGASNGLEF